MTDEYHHDPVPRHRRPGDARQGCGATLDLDWPRGVSGGQMLLDLPKHLSLQCPGCHQLLRSRLGFLLASQGRAGGTGGTRRGSKSNEMPCSSPRPAVRLRSQFPRPPDPWGLVLITELCVDCCAILQKTRHPGCWFSPDLQQHTCMRGNRVN